MGARPRGPSRRPALRPGGVSRLLLHAFLVVAPVLAAGEGPVVLGLEPFEGASEFWVRTERTEIREGPGVRASRRSHDTLDLNLVALSRLPDDTYQCVVDVLGRERSVDGGPFEEMTLEPRTYTRKLGPRLERSEPWPDDLLGPVLPSLPEKPVSPGDSWGGLLPASGPLPFPVSLEHTYVGTATVEGVLCRVIETGGVERGQDPASGLEVAVRIDAALAIDATRRTLVKYTFQARSELRSQRPDPEGYQSHLRRVERIVQPRAEEEAVDGVGPGPGLGGGFPGGESPGLAPVPEDGEGDPGGDPPDEPPPPEESGD